MESVLDLRLFMCDGHTESFKLKSPWRNDKQNQHNPHNRTFKFPTTQIIPKKAHIGTLSIVFLQLSRFSNYC